MACRLHHISVRLSSYLQQSRLEIQVLGRNLRASVSSFLPWSSGFKVERAEIPLLPSSIQKLYQISELMIYAQLHCTHLPLELSPSPANHML